MRWLALGLVVVAISGCATIQRIGERLCSIDVIHATFACDPVVPDGDE